MSFIGQFSKRTLLASVRIELIEADALVFQIRMAEVLKTWKNKPSQFTIGKYTFLNTLDKNGENNQVE